MWIQLLILTRSIGGCDGKVTPDRSALASPPPSPSPILASPTAHQQHFPIGPNEPFPAEYRQARQNISNILVTLNVSQPEYVADMLMELGFDRSTKKGLEELQVILETQQCSALVSALYHVSTSPCDRIGDEFGRGRCAGASALMKLRRTRAHLCG